MCAINSDPFVEGLWGIYLERKEQAAMKQIRFNLNLATVLI